MKRTVASRLLILALIIGTVLSLPGGLLAAVSSSASGCPHCRSVAAGLSAACCCCVPGASGHCANSGQGDSSSCRCGSGINPAFTSQVTTSAPAWPAATSVPPVITASAKPYPPNIFHPPEYHPISA